MYSPPEDAQDDHGPFPPSTLATVTHGPNLVATLAPETIRRILHFAIGTDIHHPAKPSLTREGGSPSNPYRLSRVCRQWRAVANSTPSLWTRIEAFVDDPHTIEGLASSTLKTQLHLSFPLPISVYLGRKVKTPRSRCKQERKSVKALLNALKDHFERIETLVIETDVASSLPTALDVLAKGSLIPHAVSSGGLRRLVLKCNNDESILQPLADSLPPQLPIRVLPLHRALTTFHLDGRNLLKMLALSKLGSELVFRCMPMLESLGVNNLSRCVDGFSEALIHHLFLDVLPSFKHLSTLVLESLNLEEPQYPISLLKSRQGVEVTLSTIPGPVRLHLPRLVFERTGRLSIAFVLKCILPPHTLVLDGCFLSLPQPPPSYLPTLSLNCSKLVLSHIPSDFDQSLQEPIAQWDGEYLELISCSYLDDHFWHGLITLLASSPLAPMTGNSKLPQSEEGAQHGKIPEQNAVQTRGNHQRLRHLRSLRVVDCPKVHPDALIPFLLQLRKGRGPAEQHALGELAVGGERCAKVSPVQRAWLRRLVSGRMEWAS